MDTKQVVARFEAERQALALMDHPNITRVLDAGTTDAGRPYFVMELVRGIPITKFCDQNKMATRERLDLFIKVCHAVQHAHQKGIIHRDLKPSNALVTLHDGVPVPKVIDFGIAKATQQELTDKTIHTLFQQFIGTPAYVSPEQAELSGLDIDMRCSRNFPAPGRRSVVSPSAGTANAWPPRALMNSSASGMRRRSTCSNESVRTITSASDWRSAPTASGWPLARWIVPWGFGTQSPAARCSPTAIDKSTTCASCSAGTATFWRRRAGTGPSTFGMRRQCEVTKAGGLITLRQPGEIWAMRVSAGGSRLAAGGLSPESPLPTCPIALWDTQTGQQLRTLAGQKVIAFDAAFSPDGRLLASVGDEPVVPGRARVRVWDLMSVREAFRVEAFEGDPLFFSVAISPDGRHLVAAGQDGKLRVWNTANGRKIGILGAHVREITSMKFSRDGRQLASASSDGVARIGDATRLTEWQDNPRVIQSGRGEIADMLVFTPDCTRLVVGGLLHSATICDVNTGRQVGAIEGRSRSFRALVFSPDGRWLASAGIDCAVKVWDARTFGLRHSFRGHKGNITRLAFVQRLEGLCLVSGNRDQTMKYWDVSVAK